MQNYVVYRAETPEEILECSYSLLKYLAVYNLKPPKAQSVLVFTRQPAQLETYASFFQNFEFRAPDFSPGRLATIKEFFRHYSGNLLHLDTNTYPIAPLDPLFADIENGHPYVLGWKQVTSKKTAGEKELKTIQLEGHQYSFDPAELAKWNDSVIGMNSRWKNVVDDIIISAQRSVAPIDANVMEKWIFHHKLQDQQIRTANHAIAQYDDLKEFRNLLNKFFTKYQEESVPNQIKQAAHLDAALIQQQKKAFNQLPLFQKLLRRISGRHWNIGQYEKKI